MHLGSSIAASLGGWKPAVIFPLAARIWSTSGPALNPFQTCAYALPNGQRFVARVLRETIPRMREDPEEHLEDPRRLRSGVPISPQNI